MKNYFLETVKISGKLKVRPLPGQEFKSGSPIDNTLFVSCSKLVRESLTQEGRIYLSKHGPYS